MKTKQFIALLLVLIGTNLFTFATVRYLTTRFILTRAEERLDTALKERGLFETVFPADRPPGVSILLAIPEAGGSYYWWNDALLYWTLAALLTAAGLAANLYEPGMKTGRLRRLAD